MGQSISRVPEAPAIGGVAAGREPIGRYIAQQRRLRGIDLEELSARTRIPRRSLERLEAGAFDRSPDGFSRGFVRTVAEAIGLDADDAVARMLPEPDAAQLGPPRAALWLVAGVALALLAGGVLLLRSQTRGPAATATAATGLPVRTDFVRALAEANGIQAGDLSARDAVLPPPPPEPVEPEVTVAAAQVAPAPKVPAAKSASSARTSATPPAPRSPAAASPPTAAVPAAAVPAATRMEAPPAAAGPPAEPSAAAASATAPDDSPPEPAAATSESAADEAPAPEQAPAIETVAPSAEAAATPPTDAEADD